MYLKRLEIQGFKSFADKVELEFKPGITAIVGPNGSGKSNVVDAVRWVLGEQSAKNLRGMRMDDIIFSGSNNRRPVGMAQVSITLDNSAGIFPLDFTEITVARRLYRSGESEYLINKVPCRMKDIHQLFMDTGVGREGFSIIGQGKIDEILSLKAEERRSLIEEAAGVVKYRFRKKEAQRKLDDTEQSLVRVNDIIHELTEQLEPLREQAEKAEKHQSFKNELDELEIGLAFLSLDENVKKEAEHRQAFQQINDKLTEVETIKHQLETNIEKLRFELQQMEKNISLLQQYYYDTNSKLENKEHEIAMAEERIIGIKAQIERIEQNLEKIVTEEKAMVLKESEIKQENEVVESDFIISNNELEKIKFEILNLKNEIQSKTVSLEDYKSRVIETMQESAKANNEVTRIENEKNLINRRNMQIDDKLKNLEEIFQENDNKILIAQKERNKIINYKEKLTSEIEINSDRLAININEQKNIKDLLEKEQLSFQQVKSKLLALKEMEEAGEGYQQGVKYIINKMKNKAFSQGIIGTVADVMQVPKYLEVSIENALGGALQYIITENDEWAQKAIQHLKNEKKGRATFLPLNTVKSSGINMKDFDDPNILGRASELVKYDTKYSGIIEYLLGRVLVIKNLAAAVKIGKKNKFSLRMVTLDGEIITPGGALTGGSYGKKRKGLLTRKRIIKELSVSLLEIEAKVENLKDDLIKQENEQIKLSEDINNYKDLLQNENIKVNEINNKIDQYLQEKNRIDSERQLCHLEKTELVNQETALKKEKEVNLKELIKIKEQNKDIDVRIKELQIDLKQLAKNQEDKAEELQEKNVVTATLKQSFEMGKEKIQDIQQRLNIISFERINLQKELADLQQKITEITKSSEAFQKDIINLNKLLLKSENELAEEKRNREEGQFKVNSLENEIKKILTEQEELKNKKYQIEIKISKAQMEIDALKIKLKEQYDLEYQDIMKDRIEINNKRNALKRIGELKNNIGELGLVNFGAIEEFARVNARLEFLTKQFQDLQEAKDSLTKVIKDMDQIMIKKFKETFELVNAGFNTVFSLMFGGGSASLELTDPSNLLETGIEIKAQPPGKKQQTLSLLSGGERALTAISLLFAILRIKPSPFCILDEIEAALDDANVGKFANFLKEFVQKTQFIVVSHRKGTMEVADVLYGVTIEETGVSKLISVKLSEAV